MTLSRLTSTPAICRGIVGLSARSTPSVHPVRAAFGGEVGGAMDGFDRARVGPPTVEMVVGHLTPGDVSVVDVGDFELAPRRRLQGPDDIEALGVEEVDPRHGVPRLGILRLLLDPDDLAV